MTPIFSNCADAESIDEGIFLKLSRFNCMEPEQKASLKLMDVVVGERYIKLERMLNAQYYPEGGGQNVGEGDDHRSVTEMEVAFYRFGDGYLPDPDEIESAKEEALELIEMLKLSGYKVSYADKLGRWRERAPRIGDMVTLPRDLAIDLQSSEVSEDRPDGTAYQHVYDDRYFSNRKAGNLGYEPDSTFVRITMQEMLDATSGALADATGQCRIGIAYRKLVSLVTVRRNGKSMQTSEVHCATKLTRKYRMQHIPYKRRARTLLIALSNGLRLKERWEFNWIMNNIYVQFEVTESQLIDDFYWCGDARKYKLR